MYIVFLILYLLIALSLVLLIMLQHGKGIDIGNSFSVNSLLGNVRGESTNVMTRLITILGILFFFFSLLLGNLNNKCIQKEHVNGNIMSESFNKYR